LLPFVWAWMPWRQGKHNIGNLSILFSKKARFDRIARDIIHMNNKRIGIIGLDAMHAVALTTAINSEKGGDYLGYKVTHAYPQGSKDLEYRKKNIPKHTKTVTEMGVQIVDSIEKLLQEVDQVILTSNDGHVHLEQALPVIQAGKPLFIDKPLAGTLE